MKADQGIKDFLEQTFLASKTPPKDCYEVYEMLADYTHESLLEFNECAHELITGLMFKIEQLYKVVHMSDTMLKTKGKMNDKERI